MSHTHHLAEFRACRRGWLRVDGQSDVFRLTLSAISRPHLLPGNRNIPGSILPTDYAFESWGPDRWFGAIWLDPERVYWFVNVNTAPGECIRAQDIHSKPSWNSSKVSVIIRVCSFFGCLGSRSMASPDKRFTRSRTRSCSYHLLCLVCQLPKLWIRYVDSKDVLRNVEIKIF